MIGLVQFIPTALLIFIAGHVADRYDRKRVVQLCQFGEARSERCSRSCCATTLLPIYARDILHTDAWGMGVLRAAPSVGALLMTAVLSRYTIQHKTGMRLFQAIIVFGLATLVFGLSHLMWLSFLALAVAGAADTISMVIRIALVQLETPDDMRGRVGAVNFLFVNASYQLGGFESGVTASLVGAVPSVLIGGVGTIVVALIWMKLFPPLRELDKLE